MIEECPLRINRWREYPWENVLSHYYQYQQQQQLSDNNNNNNNYDNNNNNSPSQSTPPTTTTTNTSSLQHVDANYQQLYRNTLEMLRLWNSPAEFTVLCCGFEGVGKSSILRQ